MIKKLSDAEPMTAERLFDEYADRVHIPRGLRLEKVIPDRNGCCPDLPYLLTSNLTLDGSINYSCQCACGGWCTNGHITPVGAIAEYKRMSR